MTVYTRDEDLNMSGSFPNLEDSACWDFDDNVIGRSFIDPQDILILSHC